MMKTSERVNLPIPGKGKSKRGSVVYLCGKTKYVRKGGEWETLKKAQNALKKGGVSPLRRNAPLPPKRDCCDTSQIATARANCMTDHRDENVETCITDRYCLNRYPKCK